MTDPRQLPPGEICQLLNSTPFGEVIDEWRLRRHRQQAGLRIGDSKRIDLPRYVAWLVVVRHTPRSRDEAAVNLLEASHGAAALGSRREQVRGHGQKLTSKQELLIAALLTERTYAAAAQAAGVSEATLYRWMHLPAFQEAYYQARRELINAAVGRIQAGIGQAVETLLQMSARGRRDSDRLRASTTLLDYAFRGLAEADLLRDRPAAGNSVPMGTAEVVQALSAQLQRVEQSHLPTAEKTRLLTALADALLDAIGIDLHDKRLEAIQSVLLNRKERDKS